MNFIKKRLKSLKIFLICALIVFSLAGILYWLLTDYQEEFQGSLSMQGQKLIVFDFDGTLCDSFAIVIEKYNQISTDWDLKKINDPALVRNLPLQQVLEEHAVKKWKIPFVKYKLSKMVYPHIIEMESFEGLRETLIELKKNNWRLGILSSNSKKNIMLFLKNQDMNYFDFVYSGSNLFGKARLLRKIKNQSKAASLFYVGDEGVIY